jgi:formate dehydrogenase subunit delta
MSAKQSAKLVMMANQIAKNTAIQGEDRAVASTLRHFKFFWEPRMRQALADHLAHGGAKDLHPIALKAFNSLGSPPAPAAPAPGPAAAPSKPAEKKVAAKATGSKAAAKPKKPA